MSCCGGKCGCGPNCNCGSGCNGCGMYPDMEGSSSTGSLIVGVAPVKSGSEMGFGAEGDCKCGNNPCSCGADDLYSV